MNRHQVCIDSFLSNEEDTRAIEDAIKTAIKTVMYVLCNINDKKIRQYKTLVSQKDKENETLRMQMEAAERELISLRQFKWSVEHVGPADATCSRDSGLSSEENSKQSLCAKPGLHDGEENMHSELVWCKKLTSPCEKVPDQVEHQSWEAAVNVSLVPFGEGLHHQSHGERATSSPLKTNSDTRLPPVAEGNTSSTYLPLKEEPPDYDIICVKREVCDQSVGGEGGPPLMPASPAVLALKERAPPSVGSQNHSFGVLIHPGESTVPSETCRTSRMSNREKLQRYRARIRADPEKYRAYREMDRRRYQMRKKSIKDLPEQCQKLKREAWREASRRHRARKKICPPAGPQINLMALTTEAPLDSMRILQSWK